ncbi:MAG: histidine phosphatase family protein [Alphaproteobacteria bacterium]|nr:histidine phosphatase family protein [Alphaproteobacteria bacterium]
MPFRIFHIILNIILWCIRHGQTNWNRDNKIQGTRNITLNDAGRAEAYAVAALLQGQNIEEIISSDLDRAGETARIIGEALHISVEYDARLREYDFGQFNGKSQFELAKHKAAFIKVPTAFGAEKFECFFDRVRLFMESIDYNKNTLIVSHGGTMRFMMYYMNVGPVFDIQKFIEQSLTAHIGNAAIFRIASQNSKMERFG